MLKLISYNKLNKPRMSFKEFKANFLKQFRDKLVNLKMEEEEEDDSQ